MMIKFVVLLFKMKKKAQDISINTIIVAAISLIVLIVLVFIFSNKSRDFVETGNNCEALGGRCDEYDDDKCNKGWVKHVSARCDNEGEIPCCIQIIKPFEEP